VTAKLVRDLMTREVATLQRHDKLQVANDVMRLGRIRHMPVVGQAGELVGIVSQRDLFHSALMKVLGGYTTEVTREVFDVVVVEETMQTAVVTVSPDMPLSEAAKLMMTRRIGCLVVLEGGVITGILTESDFVRFAADSET
jgi:CBS domain-containing membrane protein